MASLASSNAMQRGTQQSNEDSSGEDAEELQDSLGELNEVGKIRQSLVQVTDKKRWSQLNVAESMFFDDLKMETTKAFSYRSKTLASHGQSYSPGSTNNNNNNNDNTNNNSGGNNNIFPITDIIFCNTKDKAPPGYEKIDKTVEGNKRAEFGKVSSSEQNISLCIRRSGSINNGNNFSQSNNNNNNNNNMTNTNNTNLSPKKEQNPVTDLLIILDKDDDVVPIGYEQVLNVEGRSIIYVGKTNSNERAKLYLRRSFDSPPVNDISFIMTSKGEKPSTDTLTINSSPCGYSTNLVGYSKGIVMHLGYRQDLSHLIRPNNDQLQQQQSDNSSDTQTSKIKSRPVSLSLGVLDSLQHANLLKTTSLSSFREGISSLNKKALSSYSIIRPFVVGLYTSDSTLIEISINGLIRSVRDVPYIFKRSKNKNERNKFRETIELVIVAICDLLDRDSLNAILALELIETIVTSKKIKWCYMGSIGRLISSLLHLICRGEDVTTVNSNKCLSIIFEHLMQYTRIPNDHKASYAKRYKDEPDPSKAIIELLLDHVDRYHNTMTQTNYAILQDRQLENELLGNWSREMWDVANSIIGKNNAGVEGRSLFITLSLLCKISNLKDSNNLHTSSTNNASSDRLHRHSSSGGSDASSNGSERHPHHHMKLASMDALTKLLKVSSESFKNSPTFAIIIRRFILPTVLENAASNDIDIFEANLNIISGLWNKFRKHLKIEFAVLLENVMLRTLRSVYSTPHQKVLVIQELESWFDMQPQVLVEIFLNYDNDQTVATVAHNALFNDLCSLLCDIAEDGNAPGVDTDETETLQMVSEIQSHYIQDDKEYKESIRNLRLVALSALSQIQRGLMDASATVHLITKERDPDTRRSSGVGLSGGHTQHGWDLEGEEFDDDNSNNEGTAWPSTVNSKKDNSSTPIRQQQQQQQEGGMPSTNVEGRETTLSDASSNDGSPPPTDCNSGNGSAGRKRRRNRRASVRVRFEINKEKEKQLQTALNMAKKKSLKKCIKYLINEKYLANTPRDVVNWIRLNLDQLEEEEVGEYLGYDGGNTDADKLFMKNVRDIYMRTMNFTSLSFVEALRTMLTKGGFRLPGEAQKIDRYLETFSRIYYEANKRDFKNADVAYILSFSVVMLNTDAHNPSVKTKNKMTLKQYQRQLDGQGLTKEYVKEIYDTIVNNEIEMPKAVETAAVSQGSKRKQKSFNEEILQDPRKWSILFNQDLSFSVRRALALLKGHSSKSIVYYSKMNTEVVSLMLEVGWVHFYGCVTTILESTSDLSMVAIVLDHVRYTISACMLLGMETERRAFAALLAKISFLYSNHDWDSVGDAILFGLQSDSTGSKSKSISENKRALVQGKHLEKTWFKNVMKATAHDANVLDIIGEVHQLSASLRDAVRQRQHYEEVVGISKRFVGNTVKLLENHRRRILKEGQLVKKSHTGRDQRYTFFLFSDMLIYCGTNLRGKFKVHQYLPLESLSVVNRDRHSETFRIESPVKTFTVVADNIMLKNDWVDEIEQACHEHAAQREEEKIAAEEAKKSSPQQKKKNLVGLDGEEHHGGLKYVNSLMPRVREQQSRRMSASHSVDLEDIVESRDIDYIDEDDEDYDDDDLEEFHDVEEDNKVNSYNNNKRPGKIANFSDTNFRNRAQSGSPNAQSPLTPRMSMTSNNALKKTPATNRPGHMETITAAAAVAAASSSLHAPVPRRLSELTETKLDATFKKCLKLSREILEDRSVKFKATDAEKLQFYGLFKQATSGDCNINAPRPEEWVKRAKFDAWRAQMGSSSSSAKQRYIELLEKIAPSKVAELV